MKKVEAFIRHEAFEPIRQELLERGIPSLSISEVKGSGRQKGVVEHYRGASLTVNVRPKLKIECVDRRLREGDRRRDDPQARADGIYRRRQDLRRAGRGGDPHPHRRGGRGRAAGTRRNRDSLRLRAAGIGLRCSGRPHCSGPAWARVRLNFSTGRKAAGPACAISTNRCSPPSLPATGSGGSQSWPRTRSAARWPSCSPAIGCSRSGRRRAERRPGLLDRRRDRRGQRNPPGRHRSRRPHPRGRPRCRPRHRAGRRRCDLPSGRSRRGAAARGADRS